MLEYLLHGSSPAYWVVGNRLVGKTSLLRQLEFVSRAGHRFIPVWWDMQGCDSFKHLGSYLADAVAESGEAFHALGLAPGSLAHDDPLVLLPRLRRGAHKANQEVLLLCDETEALVKIAEGAPRSMQRLRAELTAGNGMRVVAVSTQGIYQLYDVCRDWPTSLFLAGFDMSQTLGSLSPPDARRLVLQAQEVDPVRAAPEVIEAICAYTNNHPYLLQLLCSRLFQPDGHLRMPVKDDLRIDPNLRGLLATDFRLLVLADRRLVLAVYHAQMADEGALAEKLGLSPAELHQRVHNLECLGYLRRVGGRVALGNQFLANWLEVEGAILAAEPPPMSESAMEVALCDHQAQEADFLRTQLNVHRTRLVELEAIRARDLLQVSPQVLAEIEQHQYHIKHLRRAVDEQRGGVEV
jgi:DNA-binding Lrp family transcriptional regulator